MAVAHGRVGATAQGLPGRSPSRVSYMQDRLERRLEEAGLDAAGRTRILDASGAAMAHRETALADGAHFETLHPGRTLLILLDDCGVTDADVLTAAATVESEHVSLRVPAAHALASQVPIPAEAGDALLEQLVVADETVRLIALAERLDHARHLHLRDPTSWRAFHALVGDVYSPVAARSHERLARRYAWWWRTFLRRFPGTDGSD